MPSWKKLITSGSDAAIPSISHTGDFTLDVSGDITIDADGADIILKDGGTSFGRFKRDTSDFVIKSETSNKHLLLKGNDGGATITALDLDMENAGAATFNSTISSTGLTLTSLSNQGSEATALMINGSNVVGTRELGSNAFNSTAFTTNTGTVTSVGTNTGLSGTVTTSGNLSLALSDLADMTQAWTTGEDEFIVLDNGTQKRKLSSEIFGSNAFNSTTIPTNNNQLSNGAGYITGIGSFDTDDLSQGTSNLYFSNELAQDAVGGMLTGNTETLIQVVYDDTSAKINFTVDDDLSNYDNSSSGFLTSINNTNWSGTDLAVGNGGTGASTASGARTNLGLAIGSDVQAYDAGLNAIAGLATTDSGFIVGNGSTFVLESGSTVRTSLGLGSLATLSSINNSNWSGTDLSLANGGTGASLTDPDADRIFFWDDSAGSTAFLELGANISISGTELIASDTNTNQLTTFTLNADSGTSQTIAHGNTLTIAGGTGISSVVGATDTVTLNITDNSIGDTQLAYDTGQHLTTSSSPTFAGVTLSSLSNQSSEATAVMINGSNVLGTRELGSNAFNSTTIPTNNNQLTNGAGYTTNVGDITAVVAGAGMTGGATSGEATLNVIGGDGITANADEIEVTVDDTTIELSATDGSGTVRAKTATVANSGTALATGDQIYDHVTTRISGLTGDQSASDIRGLGFFDTSNDGASSGLDADLLDGQHGSYYRDADNINAGTISDDRLPATITSDITGDVTGNLTGTASKVTVTDSTTNSNFPVVFHDESNALLDDTGALRYNPSTGTLLVPNLSVAGTTTTVDTVTMNAQNAIVFEGATADSNETTLTITDPTADRTITLPNATGTVALTSDITGTNSGTNTGDEPDASTSVKGIVELATTGETTTGTSTTLAVTPDGLKDGYQGSTNVTTLGTISTGTWQGTAINQTYLVGQSGTNTGDVSLVTTSHDYLSISNQAITLGQIDISDDTNLSAGTNITLSGDTLNVDDAFLINDGDDTTTGTITAGGFTTAGSLTLGGHAVNDIDIGGEFNDVDDHLMTSAAINDRITSFGYTTNTGTLTSVNNGDWSGTDLAVANGGTGASNASDARTNLSAAESTTFTTNNALSGRSTSAPDTAGDGVGASFHYLSSAATNKPTGTDHSLLTMAYSSAWQTQIAQDWRNGGRIYIRGQNNGTWSSWFKVYSENETVAVADGGTGAQDIATARSNLGLEIGVDVQGYDADLAAIGGLTPADGGFIVGTGTGAGDWTVESGATARTSLGLGSLATLSTINNSNWSGTDLAVANGGTGASTAANARTNLGLAIGSDVQAHSSALDSVSGTNTGNSQTSFVLEDGDGTEVTVSHNKEVKFVEGESININWTDTSNGTDGDPYDLEFSLKTAGVGAGTYGSTANGTKIDQITIDAYGRVTAVTTGATGTVTTDTNTNQLTVWNYTLNGSSGASVSHGETLNIDGGTGIEFAENSPRDFEIAFTTPTTLYNSSLKVGRDAHNHFDFSTDNVIKVEVNDVADEFRFAAGGDFHADGDVIAYSSTTASDRKLKTNIHSTKYGLDDVLKLRGVEFDWKQEDRGHDVGFIAQEVQEVIPELVKEVTSLKDEGTHLTVNYEKLVPVLVESIKELKQEIEDIKKNCDCLNK